MGGLLINSDTAPKQVVKMPTRNLNGPFGKAKWGKGKGDQKGQKNRNGKGDNSPETVAVPSVIDFQ